MRLFIAEAPCALFVNFDILLAEMYSNQAPYAEAIASLHANSNLCFVQPLPSRTRLQAIIITSPCIGLEGRMLEQMRHVFSLNFFHKSCL